MRDQSSPPGESRAKACDNKGGPAGASTPVVPALDRHPWMRGVLTVADILPPPSEQHETPRTCTLPGCDRAVHARQLCDAHYRRLLRNGHPSALRGKGHRLRSAEASYNAVHLRLKYDRGAARERRCVDCGARAQAWSYDHGDPDQLIDARGRPYSLKQEHYAPRCWPCHNPIDRAAKRLREAA